MAESAKRQSINTDEVPFSLVNSSTPKLNVTLNQYIIGWTLSVLLFAFLMFSVSGKFRDFEGKEVMFDHLGYSNEIMTKIGIVEIIVAVLFMIPRTAFLGAVLLTAYLGGATATHARVGDSFVFPILVGVVAWVAYGLRRPEVFSLAFGAPASDRPTKSAEN